MIWSSIPELPRECGGLNLLVKRRRGRGGYGEVKRGVCIVMVEMMKRWGNWAWIVSRVKIVFRVRAGNIALLEGLDDKTGYQSPSQHRVWKDILYLWTTLYSRRIYRSIVNSTRRRRLPYRLRIRNQNWSETNIRIHCSSVSLASAPPSCFNSTGGRSEMAYSYRRKS